MSFFSNSSSATSLRLVLLALAARRRSSLARKGSYSRQRGFDIIYDEGREHDTLHCDSHSLATLLWRWRRTAASHASAGSALATSDNGKSV